MSDQPAIPDSYRLLAVFSGEPTNPLQAIARAGFIDEHDHPTPYGRGVLRGLRDQKLVRWPDPTLKRTLRASC